MTLHRGHPIRAMLDEATFGREPTRRQLDELLAGDDQPESVDLARLRTSVARAATAIAAAAVPGEGIRDLSAARQVADRHLADLEARMTPEERGITGTGPVPTEEIDRIAARMFRS